MLLRNALLATLMLNGMAFTAGTTGQVSPQPLMVLIERDPWLDVIGSDMPRIAVYSNGLVIYQTHPQRNQMAFWHVNVSDSNLAAVQRCVTDSFFALGRYYDSASCTDLPTQEIHVWRNGRHKQVSVYGDLSADKSAYVGRDPRWMTACWVRNRTPRSFLSVYDRLMAFGDEGSAAWLPDSIEVMLWPFEYSQPAPVDWPRDWPGLDKAIRHEGSDLLHLYLPVHTLDSVRTLMDQMRGDRAVFLGGHKWAMSYRYPFPAESRWMSRGDK